MTATRKNNPKMFHVKREMPHDPQREDQRPCRAKARHRSGAHPVEAAVVLAAVGEAAAEVAMRPAMFAEMPADWDAAHPPMSMQVKVDR